jgi:hypothetical protein
MSDPELPSESRGEPIYESDRSAGKSEKIVFSKTATAEEMAAALAALWEKTYGRD